MWLLDTNVVSETRKARPHGGVMAWIDRQPAESLNVSAVTLGELQAGVEITRRTDPAKAAEIEAWMEMVEAARPAVPADAAVFRHWARLMSGKSNDLMMDGLIAATAQVHGLTVVSRNVGDFAALGVEAVDPFKTPER